VENKCIETVLKALYQKLNQIKKYVDSTRGGPALFVGAAPPPFPSSSGATPTSPVKKTHPPTSAFIQELIQKSISVEKRFLGGEGKIVRGGYTRRILNLNSDNFTISMEDSQSTTLVDGS
jgi:hypothetical protein